MTEHQDQYIAVLEARVAESEKAYFGLQQILAFVLLTLDEEVTITDEMITNGIPEGLSIYVEMDEKTHSHKVGITDEQVENRL